LSIRLAADLDRWVLHHGGKLVSNSPLLAYQCTLGQSATSLQVIRHSRRYVSWAAEAGFPSLCTRVWIKDGTP